MTTHRICMPESFFLFMFAKLLIIFLCFGRHFNIFFFLNNWTWFQNDRVQHLSDLTVQLLAINTKKKYFVDGFYATCHLYWLQWFLFFLFLGLNVIKCRYNISDLDLAYLQDRIKKTPLFVKFFWLITLWIVGTRAHILQHNQWPLIVKLFLSCFLFFRSPSPSRSHLVIFFEHYYYSFWTVKQQNLFASLHFTVAYATCACMHSL